MAGSRLAVETRAIRRAIAALGHRGRTERIPLPIRARVMRVVEAGRAEGRSWRELAHGVGLAVTTIERWSALARRSRPALVPVQVEAVDWTAAPEAGRRPGLAVVSASGVRLEGVSVAEAISVLRALG
jgi:hypothetical protein